MATIKALLVWWGWSGSIYISSPAADYWTGAWGWEVEYNATLSISDWIYPVTVGVWWLWINYYAWWQNRNGNPWWATTFNGLSAAWWLWWNYSTAFWWTSWNWNTWWSCVTTQPGKWWGGWNGWVWWNGSSGTWWAWWAWTSCSISWAAVMYWWGGWWSASVTVWAWTDGWGSWGKSWVEPTVPAANRWWGSGGWYTFIYASKNGADWVVIISYATDGSDGITVATGWTITTSWWQTIHTFTSSWNFIVWNPTNASFLFLMV